MTLPHSEPLVALESAVRVIPEPPRRGEPGGEPCHPLRGSHVGGVVRRPADAASSALRGTHSARLGSGMEIKRRRVGDPAAGATQFRPRFVIYQIAA